jgi:low temperature requirement protein LtrA
VFISLLTLEKQKNKKHFRIWWQKPRRYSEQESERRVTFLELFYDLVYVVIIAQLSHALAVDINMSNLLQYVFLFFIVWWAWFNGVAYHDLHGNNDIKTRVVTFLQMIAVASMAVFAHSAIGSGSKGFAISYIAFQLIITYLWWRTGVHDRDHRSLSIPYTLTYLGASFILMASLFVPTPLRYYLWAVNLLMTLSLPLILQVLSTWNEKMKIQFDRAATISPSINERFGLLTIIVLGEVIVGVIGGIAGQHHLEWQTGIIAVLGMLIAIGIWWLYFDLVASHTPKKSTFSEFSWAYLHLPLVISIAASGAAVLNVIEHSAEESTSNAKYLLIGAVFLAIISISLILRTIQSPDHMKRVHRVAGRATIISAVALLPLIFLNIDSIFLMVLLNAIMLVPIFYGIRFWLKEQIPTSD